MKACSGGLAGAIVKRDYSDQKVRKDTILVSVMPSTLLSPTRVLVVNDNKADLVLIAEAFKECSIDCEVSFATSHREALSAISNKPFDLIVSDFGGSVDAGQCFLRSVPAVSARIPIVVLSGFPNPIPAYEAGANVFVAKQWDPDRFFADIRDIMKFWTEVAVLPSLRS